MATTAELEAEFTRLLKQARAINASIVAEKERGNVAGVKLLLAPLQNTLAQMKTVNTQIGGQSLTDWDRTILSLGNWVANAPAAVGKAAADALVATADAVGKAGGNLAKPIVDSLLPVIIVAGVGLVAFFLLKAKL